MTYEEYDEIIKVLSEEIEGSHKYEPSEDSRDCKICGYPKNDDLHIKNTKESIDPANPGEDSGQTTIQKLQIGINNVIFGPVDDYTEDKVRDVIPMTKNKTEELRKPRRGDDLTRGNKYPLPKNLPENPLDRKVKKEALLEVDPEFKIFSKALESGYAQWVNQTDTDSPDSLIQFLETGEGDGSNINEIMCPTCFGIESVTCDVCHGNKTIDIKSPAHEIMGEFSCPYDGANYHAFGDLLKHTLYDHANIGSNEAENPEELKCKYNCGFKTSSQAELDDHERGHRGAISETREEDRKLLGGMLKKEQRPGERKVLQQLISKTSEASQIDIGTKIEMEHTDDKEEAKKIAQTHLDENPNYYHQTPNVKKEELQVPTKENIDNLKCDDCGKQFKNEDDYKEHVDNAHESFDLDKWLESEEKRDKVMSLEEAIEALGEEYQTDKGTYKCKDCDYETSDAKKIENHGYYAGHDVYNKPDGKEAEDSTDGVRAPRNLDDLQEKVKKNDNLEEGYKQNLDTFGKCRTCGISYNDHDDKREGHDFIAPISKEIEEPYNKCKSCGEKFDSAYELIHHINKEHKSEEASERKECPMCGGKMEFNSRVMTDQCKDCKYYDEPTEESYAKEDGLGLLSGILDPQDEDKRDIQKGVKTPSSGGGAGAHYGGLLGDKVYGNVKGALKKKTSESEYTGDVYTYTKPEMGYVEVGPSGPRCGLCEWRKGTESCGLVEGKIDFNTGCCNAFLEEGEKADESYFIKIKSLATEGGPGSGRDGHQKWMRGVEEFTDMQYGLTGQANGTTHRYCGNCIGVRNVQEGKCTICGKKNFYDGNEVMYSEEEEYKTESSHDDKEEKHTPYTLLKEPKKMSSTEAIVAYNDSTGLYNSLGFDSADSELYKVEEWYNGQKHEWKEQLMEENIRDLDDSYKAYESLDEDMRTIVYTKWTERTKEVATETKGMPYMSLKKEKFDTGMIPTLVPPEEFKVIDLDQNSEEVRYDDAMQVIGKSKAHEFFTNIGEEDD